MSCNQLSNDHWAQVGTVRTAAPYIGRGPKDTCIHLAHVVTKHSGG